MLPARSGRAHVRSACEGGKFGEAGPRGGGGRGWQPTCTVSGRQSEAGSHAAAQDSEPITALAYTPAGDRLFTASRSLLQRSWDANTGRSLRSWKVPPHPPPPPPPSRPPPPCGAPPSQAYRRLWTHHTQSSTSNAVCWSSWPLRGKPRRSGSCAARCGFVASGSA